MIVGSVSKRDAQLQNAFLMTVTVLCPVFVVLCDVLAHQSHVTPPVLGTQASLVTQVVSPQLCTLHNVTRDK
jgi:hypothetical protein